MYEIDDSGRFFVSTLVFYENNYMLIINIFWLKYCFNVDRP